MELVWFFSFLRIPVFMITFSLTRLTKMKESIKLQKDKETHCPRSLIVELKAHRIVCFSQRCRFFFSIIETRLEETSRSVFQPPAQGRVSTAFKSCCSRLCPVGSGVPPRREIPQPP